jgi:protoporphyrinogen oxidase
MRIGVVGGGLMGLALAERLGAQGHSVCVYERETQPGGLATWQDFGRFVWDRFYHVILPTDLQLIAFIERIGLADQLRWCATRTGYYVDGRTHSLSSSADFLRFAPLGPWHKLRLALTILYCARIRDWRRLEAVTVEEFLVRTSGRATFEKFWKPLLLAKLGDNYRRVSAVFIWTYISRLYSARSSAARREQLGHVAGGYRRIFTRLLELIGAQGGELRSGVAVSALRPAQAGTGIEIACGESAERYDQVIFTGPADLLRRLADPRLISIAAAPGAVEYLGVVCVVVVTRKPLLPYYVLNIADERLPFTGAIGMSTVVPPEETGGLYLTYLPKYLLSDDPLLRAPEAELRALFMEGFARLFPDFGQADIESVHVHRAGRVQPLQVLHYSRLVQPPRTRHPDFHVVNTAQFLNSTLNNNEVIRAVNAYMDDQEARRVA